MTLNMSPKSVIMYLTVGSAVALALSSASLPEAWRQTGDPHRGDGDALAAYPPVYPTATATPVPDGSGLYPAPIGLDVVDTTIAASDVPELLGALAADLAGQDVGTLASYVNGAVKLSSATEINGSALFTEADVTEIFTQFFGVGGSTPVLQGYFVYQDDAPMCVVVVSAEWTGSVDVDKITLMGGLDHVVGPAFGWHMCDSYPTPGVPVIGDWAFGAYYSLLWNLAGALEDPVYHRLVP